MKKLVSLLILLLPFNVAASLFEKRSVLLYNQSKGEWVIRNNDDQLRSIASLTKIMTAMVALDYDNNLERKLKLSKRVGGQLPPNSYTREELFHAMLIRSDNAAAETLADDYPGGRTEFIKAMNAKAVQLKMDKTVFADPTGLLGANVSVLDNVRLMLEASAIYPLIRDTSIKKQAIFESMHNKKIRKVILHNTNNRVLFEFDNIVVSKTGYTTKAGFCLGLVVEQNQQRYIAVILGARDIRERFNIVNELMFNHINESSLK